MRALQVLGPGQLTVSSLPNQDLGPGDVRVRVHSVGLCGTDFSLVSGTLGFNTFPVIPGHELSGTVTASRSRSLDEGQRVVLDPVISCGSCSACIGGHRQLCDRVAVLGVAGDGGCREEVVFPAERWVPVPIDMDLADAALVEPVQVAVTVFRSLAGERPGSVLLIGAGAIGLMLAAVLRHALPEARIAMTDLLPERIGHARAFGVEVLSTADEGRFDCVVDGVGAASSMTICSQRIRPGGEVVVYGVPKAGTTWTDANQLFRKNARVRFTRLYAADFSAAVGLVSEHVVSTANLVGTSLDLESAIPYLRDRSWEHAGHWGKALVRMTDV